MFPRIRWRIAISYISLILFVMIGMSLYIIRPFCITSPTCIQQTLLAASIVMLIGILVISHLISERTARPLQQLTNVARRITAGDKSARILPHTKDEVGTLVHAFSEMTEQLQLQNPQCFWHLPDAKSLVHLAGDYSRHCESKPVHRIMRVIRYYAEHE